jgi:hypothetical protein
MAKVEHGSRSQAIRDYFSSNPKAGPKEVVAALKAKGIEVKLGLVSNVKHHMMSRKSRRRASAKRRSKAPAITGTQAIQAYLKKHPKAGPAEIRSRLADQGITVSKSLASAVKYRRRKRRAPSVRLSARRTAAGRSAMTVEQLLAVKRVADALGGLDRVRQALEALAQLR